MLGALYRGLLDLVAPSACPACGLDGPDGGFCGACAPLIEPHEGLRLGGYVYAGPLADAIRRFKYGRRSDLAPALTTLLAAALEPLAGTYDVISFVPLHDRRLRERGFDQAGLLAHGVGRRLGVPVQSLLVRRRHTAVQASLDRTGRTHNVRDAFVARPCTGRVLLLDDVRTTGATLAEAARALTAGGAEVICFALAVADG